MPHAKSQKIKILEKVMKKMAVLILKKYNPKIIGITGSLGKTSAKEAIFSVLSSKFQVRKSEKNYNNEIGLPLTIIGALSGGKSLLGWAKVALKWLSVFFLPVEYPEILILEMGADRPGDIEYLVSFLKCEVAVMTDVSGSHLEFFKSIEGVAEEKWKLITSVKEGGWAILNVDNPNIAKLSEQNKREDLNIITYGFSESADLKAAELFYNYSDEKDLRFIRGLSFKLNYKGSTIPVRLNNVLVGHSIYAALSAIACGLSFKLNLVEIAASLIDFTMPAGRMTLIPGIKNSFIIDDTYNASPVSTAAALKVLNEISAKRKIAVLGDMLELGAETETAHRELARAIADSGAAYFIAVGQRMKYAAAEIHKMGFPKDKVLEFDSPDQAKRKLQDIINPEDLVLVKGSQAMRMEKIVLEVMAEPEKASELLCRQDNSWRNNPWKSV